MPKKKKDDPANEMMFKIDSNDFQELFQNVLNSQEGINGIILHNLEIKGFTTDELVENLIFNLNKEEIEFTILDLSNEKMKPINYLETSGMKQSHQNLKENENIEKIFAVIQRLNLETETTKLIQERINDELPIDENKLNQNDSKQDLIVDLLRNNINKMMESEIEEKGIKKMLFNK
jgi:hypothetical protein